MESSRPDNPHPGNARPVQTAQLIRLALVLVAAVAFIRLFKPATAVNSRLQAVLDARVQAVRAGDRQAFQRLHDAEAMAASIAWWAYQAGLFHSYQGDGEQAGTAAAPPHYPDVEIVAAGRQMDSAWAWVTPAGQVDAPRRIEFFRRIGGRWQLTAPDPAYWGQEVVHQSVYFVWHYRASDDEWVTGLAPAIDAAWGRIATDFNVSLQPALIPIGVCYSFDCGTGRGRDARGSYVMTPLLIGSSVDATADVIISWLIGQQASLVVGGGGGARGVGAASLLAALYTWEKAQITGREPGWVAPLLAQAAAADAFLSLDAMSLTPGSGQTLAHAQGYALVDYLVSRYGRGVVPALLRAAGARSSVTVVLQDVLGSNADITALEQEWFDYLRTTY